MTVFRSSRVIAHVGPSGQLTSLTITTYRLHWWLRVGIDMLTNIG